MYKKNTVPVIVCGLFFSLFYFNVACGSDECSFYGLMSEPSQWEKNEFSILLGEDSTSDYLLMVRIIGKIVATDKNILKSPSCKISRYVAELIQFYDKNKITIREKHKDIAGLLDFIKNKIK